MNGFFRINDVVVEQLTSGSGRTLEQWVLKNGGREITRGKDFSALCQQAITLALAPAKEAIRGAGEFPAAGGPE